MEAPVHNDPQAFTVDPDAIRAWLRQPSDDHPEFSNADDLGVDDDVTGLGEADFLPTVRRVLAAEPDGVHRRPDVIRVELWLIPDGEILHQGALITVDLSGGIRLASLHQDAKDFTDHDQRGVSAILSALGHIAVHVCALVDRHEASHPDGRAPASDGVTGSGDAATAATYTKDAVSRAANDAADDILDAVEAGDAGLRDALNLLVNATLGYLTGDAEDLTDLVAINYDEATYDEVLSWIEEAS
jgi:hypothetical protein